MSDISMRIRVDEKEKVKFEKICQSMGINMTSAVNMFIYAVNREGRIPFEIKSPNEDSKERV
ncbi:hypothetical protein FACS1894120_4910 [Clostridia bacterium]|nr:hypothetical protein FACS1894120_4910 [Clostridia bacterium]